MEKPWHGYLTAETPQGILSGLPENQRSTFPSNLMSCIFFPTWSIFKGQANFRLYLLPGIYLLSMYVVCMLGVLSIYFKNVSYMHLLWEWDTMILRKMVKHGKLASLTVSRLLPSSPFVGFSRRNILAGPQTGQPYGHRLAVLAIWTTLDPAGAPVEIC